MGEKENVYKMLLFLFSDTSIREIFSKNKQNQ